MWSAVISANAMATEMEWAVTVRISPGSSDSAGWMIDATAGSPIHPRPRLVIVMASWVAAM